MEIDKQQRDQFGDYIFRYCLVTLFLFCLRDGFTGSARYYFQVFGVGFLWFVPDMMAFGCVFIFSYLQIFKEKNPIGIFFIIAFLWSVFVSAIFMNDSLFSIFSSVKMFIPMFVGFCFYKSSATEVGWLHKVFLFVFFMSAIGVIINPYVVYPWYGQTLVAFGMEREATKLWWYGGVIRYGGFAGDSTMAGFMILFTYIMISPYRGVVFNIICWPLMYFALDTTTSKTAIGLFFIYVLFYCYLNTVPSSLRLRVVKMMTRFSFIFLVIPPVLMITLSGVDLGAVSENLESLADRINNTWVGPFVWISEIFPSGLFIGCGIGCYSYPMLFYTDMAKFYLPLDNFYLASLLMMGYPFLLFIVILFFKIPVMRDPVKMSLLIFWNVYTTTIQGYGPSYATLIFGYAISEIFGRVSVRRPSRLSLFSARQSSREPEAEAAGQPA